MTRRRGGSHRHRSRAPCCCGPQVGNQMPAPSATSLSSGTGSASTQPRPQRLVIGFLPKGRRLPDDVWLRRHIALTWLLWGHVPALLGFGLLRGISPVVAGAQVALLVGPG